MKAILLVPFVAGCLDVEPARDYDVRLTYNGARSAAVITFPSYSHSADQPATVTGMVISGDAPIAGVELHADDIVTLSIEVDRATDDPDTDHAQIECEVDESQLGHAIECMFSRHACSIVVEDTP